MANRNFDRRPRWNNSGYWTYREEDDQREGDRELSRSYDREDMRRYGRKSQDQGERLRGSMRGGEPYRNQDYRHAHGGGEEYNSEMARGRGFERYRDEDQRFRRGGELSRGYGVEFSPRYPDPDEERGFNRFRNRDSERDYSQRNEGIGNFYGERSRRRHYSQEARGRDFTHGRDFDHTVQGGEGSGGGWDNAELDREFDLDPGFSYEFGTDFSELDQTDLREYDRNRRREGRNRREEWQVPGEFSGIGPRGYQRSTERITEDICERLTRHGQIDARGIEIQVENGEVTLNGSVDEKQEKYLAEYLAETVSGVKEVNNLLRVNRSRQ
jgi:hypothetical protein